MLLHVLLDIPRTGPRTTVSCAETLLKQQCKQILTCCRWGRAQPHCTARNHLGWCSACLYYEVLPCSCASLSHSCLPTGSTTEGLTG